MSTRARSRLAPLGCTVDSFFVASSRILRADSDGKRSS